MEKPNKPSMLRGIGYYLIRALKFHDLRSGYTAPFVFVLLLIFNAAYTVISLSLPIGEFYAEFYAMADISTADVSIEGLMNSIRKLEPILSNILLSRFAAEMLISAALFLYLHAFIKQMHREELTLNRVIKETLSRIMPIGVWAFILQIPFLLAGVLLRIPGAMFYLGAAVFLLFIPATILYVMFIFCPSLILDKRMGLMQALKNSFVLTRGHKIEIFSILLIFNFVSVVAVNYADTLSAALNNNLVVIFVHAFFTSIFNLVELRAIALMYNDLQYGWRF